VAVAYVVGKGKGLVPGHAYVLTIDYPDDVARTIYLANRGADYYRGWATGTATGDVRGQFAEVSPESLNYPQTGQWQTQKQFFYLLNRFQGIKSVRDPKPGCRPFLPADGFHVVIFQSKQICDPRSQGAAIGKIRLYEVAEPEALYAPIHYPPSELPKRRIFWREEMADQIIQTNDPEIQAVDDSIDWYRYKMRMARVLGINTFTKDLLEFGFNQGWETGDEEWVLNAQPPNKDLWTRLVPAATEEGMDLLPYYEYKTGIGSGLSLAKQHRAQKLYHGLRPTCGYSENYTCVYWTEGHNGDVTDPDTLEDAKRLMDKTVIDFKGRGHFAGAWFRTRNTHLPMSFSDATIARFKVDLKDNASAQEASQKTLIASYEGDKVLYDQYVEWWFTRRAKFLQALQEYVAAGLEQKDAQILYTPWTGEAVPVLHAKDSFYNHPGVVTDDPGWWKEYAKGLDGGYWTYHWMPTDFTKAVEENWYGWLLRERVPIGHSNNHSDQESFHSAPPADPEHCKKIDGVMMTFPMGRLFTVSHPPLLDEFRAASGLTVVKHYALNEEHEEDNVEPSPFGHLVGYISVDCDRAGNLLMLEQARAMAYGDPRNIAYLSGSSFSTGFPEVMRRFNQAFLALPALPSERVTEMVRDEEVVVRKIVTPKDGTYYSVVNTSMQRKEKVVLTFPEKSKIQNLVTNSPETGSTLTLDLDAAELRSYQVVP
jgi:hypothetical protein